MFNQVFHLPYRPLTSPLGASPALSQNKKSPKKVTVLDPVTEEGSPAQITTETGAISTSPARQDEQDDLRFV